MDNFWKWMEENYYAEKHRQFYVLRGMLTAPPKQTLIGYMMEYIHEKDILKEGKEGIINTTDETYGELQGVIEEAADE